MLAPELPDGTPIPTICTVQFGVASDGASPQDRARDVREKEREPGAREICFGSVAERARRWVGGGRGDVVLVVVVVEGVKVV